jgi:hypothetical protein
MPGAPLAPSFSPPVFTPPAPQTFAPPPIAAPPPQPFAPQTFAPSPAGVPPSALAVRPPPGLPGAAPIYGTAMAPPIGFQQTLAESVDDHAGTRAVEVAAMMGETVVDVKHCIDPRGGRVRPLTWAMFIVGILTLGLSIAAFSASVRNAAYNKGRFDYETQVLKKPAYAVRPHTLSPGVDVLAFGGIVISIASLAYCFARARKERETAVYRIGTGREVVRNWVVLVWILIFVVWLFSPVLVLWRLVMGRPLKRKLWSPVEFATEGAPEASFEMISAVGDEFAFNFGRGMDGEMVVGGQTSTLAELAAQGRTTVCPIPAGAKIRVRVGPKTVFLISSVAQPRRQMLPLFATLESRVVSYFVGSLVVHLGLWALLAQLPPDAGGANIDLGSLEDTTTRTSSTSQDDPPPEKQEDKPDNGQDQSGGTGTAMQLDEGKMGKKDSDRAEGQYKMKKNQDDPVLARQAAIEEAKTAGILGSSALTQGGAFASLTGTGDISSGFDENNIYGGLLGNEAGEMQGGFGYGRSGFGPGGGGTGWGTIGTGRYGTIGHGSGTGEGYGVGGGRGGMRGRSSAVPPVSIGQPSAEGDLDKAIIRRYIKRNVQKIQYCYEKQLLAKPSLAGTVSAQFFITPNGTVAQSTGSGVDPEVASCVAEVIKNIEFPKPKGGGGVQVNYPFTFHSSGGG